MPADFAATPYSTTTLPVNTFPVSAVFVPGTASGNLTALQGGPASTDGNGYTSAPMAVYQATGTNLHTVVDSGTVTVNQGGSWAVTANAGTNLNTSLLALDTSVNGILLAQGSTTSGEKGPLIQGAVTTGSPSYTTAQTSPLSLTTAGALRVDASATTQPVSGTFWQTTQPVSGTVTADAGTGTFTVSGTVTANQGGTWTVQPGNTPNTAPWLMQSVVGTSGGSTSYHNVVSSGTNGTNVKGSAGQVYDGVISNTSASAVYFRFYDTASAPTVGTTTVKRTIQVPGNGTVIFSWPNGLKFTSGIAWGITASVADNDATAISASVSIDFGYV